MDGHSPGITRHCTGRRSDAGSYPQSQKLTNCLHVPSVAAEVHLHRQTCTQLVLYSKINRTRKNNKNLNLVYAVPSKLHARTCNKHTKEINNHQNALNINHPFVCTLTGRTKVYQKTTETLFIHHAFCN